MAFLRLDHLPAPHLPHSTPILLYYFAYGTVCVYTRLNFSLPCEAPAPVAACSGSYSGAGLRCMLYASCLHATSLFGGWARFSLKSVGIDMLALCLRTKCIRFWRCVMMRPCLLVFISFSFCKKFRHD
ncbi:hypothetical protein P171DRAFT_253215 [Karstenula rhodostoma CBS 690.94]|uniref:Uncharacterized protein n=1 Tax=Karstenula rhodostoma CBS 690.94 TaxID=1392251 RepID=A0A9P4PNR1_9PLEO|nr:hypothetical protein P171DRAFT_253215 [Karstenula rhodostoma CBS 690.94]